MIEITRAYQDAATALMSTSNQVMNIYLALISILLTKAGIWVIRKALQMVITKLDEDESTQTRLSKERGL